MYNVLVDYREDSISGISKDINVDTFQDELEDTGIFSMMVSSGIRTVRGRLYPNDKDKQLRGLQLRDTLKLSLADHDM